MKIDEIRPRDITKLQESAYAIDLNRYTDRLPEFTERACPGCGSGNSKFFCKHHNFIFEKCKACFTVFMNPGPTEEIVKELYESSANYEFWSKEMYPATRESRRATLHRSRAEYVVSKIFQVSDRKALRILEVGAGTGDSISVLKEIYLGESACYVIEPNPSMWDAISDNNLKIVESLSELELQSFDLILGFEVLEHVLNPLDFLKNYSKYLASNGSMIFSTPNAHSMEVQLLKEKSTTVDIEHISILSPAGIHSLARFSNLEVVEIETPGEFDLELIESSIALDPKMFRAMRRTKSEIQEFVSDFGFSSHMKIVLKNQE